MLKGVVSQRLLRTVDGKGRVPAIEVLLPTPRIVQLLREGGTTEIYDALKEGHEYYGTLSFNQSVGDLFNRGLITFEDAMATADRPDEFQLASKGIKTGTGTSDFDFGDFKKK
jgi:twitching motility protein PilT